MVLIYHSVDPELAEAVGAPVAVLTGEVVPRWRATFIKRG